MSFLLYYVIYFFGLEDIICLTESFTGFFDSDQDRFLCLMTKDCK